MILKSFPNDLMVIIFNFYRTRYFQKCTKIRKKFKCIQKNQRIHLIRKINISSVYVLDNYFSKFLIIFWNYYYEKSIF